jgi:hypothetical protein
MTKQESRANPQGSEADRPEKISFYGLQYSN